MPPVKVNDSVTEEVRRRIESFFENIDCTKQSIEKHGPLEPIHDNYSTYLRRKLWRTIRNRIWERDGKICCRCGGAADAVHHRSYEDDVMLGNDDSQLASICEGCHTVIHFDDNGNRRTAEETDKMLLERTVAADFPIPKVDLRRKRHIEPGGWHRMSAVQRNAWRCEYNKLRAIRLMQRSEASRKTTQ